MPLTYTLAGGAIRYLTVGDVEWGEGTKVLRAGLVEAAASPERPAGGWNLLFDIRASTENRSSDEIGGIASNIAEHEGALSRRCAVVASEGLQYGLARMFGAYMESLGLRVGVFTTDAAAERFLADRR